MDPQSVEALVNHGMLAVTTRRDWDGARRMAEQALTMQPGQRLRDVALKPGRRGAGQIRRGAR